MAEAQGFEPWIPLGMPVFKTGAFNRSAKLPEIRGCKDRDFFMKSKSFLFNMLKLKK
jgi:hypothetical protein